MQESINERIKFLIDSLKMSVRAFSAALDTPVSTTRNYLDKGTKPSTDYIERISEHFKTVNIHWLITGQGEPFLSEKPENGITQTGNFNQAGTRNVQKVRGSRNAVVGANYGTAMQQNGAPAPDEKTLAALALAEREIQHLRDKLAASEALVASKEETISVLRAAFTRPN